MSQLQITDAEKFNYYCLMNTKAAFECLNAGITDFADIRSVMYGMYVEDGEPLLGGYKEFRKLLIKVARAAADKSLKEIEKRRIANVKRS